jgi:hypothetical protein
MLAMYPRSPPNRQLLRRYLAQTTEDYCAGAQDGKSGG